jgi:hypothetical protein
VRRGTVLKSTRPDSLEGIFLRQYRKGVSLRHSCDLLKRHSREGGNPVVFFLDSRLRGNDGVESARVSEKDRRENEGVGVRRVAEKDRLGNDGMGTRGVAE